MKRLALLLPLLAAAARGTELFVPDAFYARVPDRAAKEDLVSISVEAEAAEGPPGACALSVRSDEDDVHVVVEYAVAVSSGDEPCSVRLSCALEPEEFASVSPGLTDLAGRPAPDAAARLRPLLEAADPRLGEEMLLLERTKALFLATLEAPPRHVLRDGDFVPLDGAAAAEPPLPPPFDWASAVRTNRTLVREADFRDRELLPLLREEALEPLVSGPDRDAPWLEEARGYVERELERAWLGPARLTDRPNPDWGRAYDFTIREGSRDPFLTWMSVVGQKKWHWDDKARAQLAEMEEALAARPADEAPFARLLAAHARQWVDPSSQHARALCAAAVRWAESHAARPERSEAVLRVLEQFVDARSDRLVAALFDSGADPWIGLVLAGRVSLARRDESSSAAERRTHLENAGLAFRRAWELHPEFPQGAFGMMETEARWCGRRESRDAWFRAALAARFDSPELPGRSARWLAWNDEGGPASLRALRAHAEACLGAGRDDSMLPWCGLLGLLHELAESGRRPAEFFADDALVRTVASAAAALASAGTAAKPAARGGAASLLACIHASRGNLLAALAADAGAAGVGTEIQRCFPGGFHLQCLLTACAESHARRVLPLARRLLAGDAAGCYDGAEAILRGPGARSLDQVTAHALEHLSMRGFLATRFDRGEERFVGVLRARNFCSWFNYNSLLPGEGWRLSMDPDPEGTLTALVPGAPRPLEFIEAVPLPLEVSATVALQPDAGRRNLFAVRLDKADGLFGRFADDGRPALSFHLGEDGRLAVRYWAPREEGGVWFGAEDASAAVDLPPLPEGADPAAPREVALRAVFRPDRVEAFVGDAPAPALVFATDRYAPAAFPDGAKLLFFGKGASFHGFTFRKPHAESAEPGSPVGGAGERGETEGVSHAESAESESHAENAEPAEPGSPAGGAGERSETEGVSHAENAESAEP